MNEKSAGSVGENAEDPTSSTETPEMGELEADIARTRGELADTVDQLAAKLDVKTRVRNRVADTKDSAVVQVRHQARNLRDQATDEDGRPTPVALTTGGGLVAAVAAVVLVALWMRTSKRRGGRRRR